MPGRWAGASLESSPISESGGSSPVPPPMPMMMEARAQSADSKILPGEQKLQVTLSIVFDLQ